MDKNNNNNAMLKWTALQLCIYILYIRIAIVKGRILILFFLSSGSIYIYE